MSDEDPLLSLIPARPLEENNKLRAQIIADQALAAAYQALRYEQARERICTIALRHIIWAQIEALGRHGSEFATPVSVAQQARLAREIMTRLELAIVRGEIDP